MTFDADELREIERTRLRALVDVDLVVAEELHAEDYQLITPRGVALSKAEYLGEIASGELDYHVFEPASEIAVRGDDRFATLRYRARIGFDGDPFLCWHTDCYEHRDGRWQAVWSQATLITI